MGALYVREGVRIAPLVAGGEQERGLRGGTTNVAGAVGMAEALSLARAELSAAQLRAGGACEAFVRLVLAEAEGACAAERPRQACLSLASGGRLYSLANFSFAGVDGPALLALLDRLGVAASGGSACSSGSPEPSPVLAAMGLPASLARSGVRFSFGRENTEADAGGVLPPAAGAGAAARPLSGGFSRQRAGPPAAGRSCTKNARPRARRGRGEGGSVCANGNGK